MLHRNNGLTRLITAGLAIAATAPAAAVGPADRRQAGGPRLTQQDLRAPDQRAPDQTGAHGATPYGGTPAPTAPQWPANPQPVGHAKATPTTQSTDDGGLDTGIWVAIGGAAAVAAAGLGLAGQKRQRTTRQRQPAEGQSRGRRRRAASPAHVHRARSTTTHGAKMSHRPRLARAGPLIEARAQVRATRARRRALRRRRLHASLRPH